MKKLTSDRVMFNLIAYFCTGFFALVCILPFLLVVSGSLTDESYIIKNGFSFIPGKFSIAAYEFVMKTPTTILRAYAVTICVTVIGTFLGLFITAMTAYVLQRKDFEWRNKFSFFFFFTTLFGGGLVPWYILMVQYLKMHNNYLALIIPSLFGVFNMLIMKSFMRSIPDAISESAKIDGANDFSIFIKLILPLSKPALATIGLFIALACWNDWFTSMLFMGDPKKFTLQYFLYKIINDANAAKAMAQNAPGMSAKIVVPGQSFNMALTVIVTGPIVLLYPFVQKYFVQGISIGAVKG